MSELLRLLIRRELWLKAEKHEDIKFISVKCDIMNFINNNAVIPVKTETNSSIVKKIQLYL